jgi:hypothetical protein
LRKGSRRFLCSMDAQMAVPRDKNDLRQRPSPRMVEFRSLRGHASLKALGLDEAAS